VSRADALASLVEALEGVGAAAELAAIARTIAGRMPADDAALDGATSGALGALVLRCVVATTDGTLPVELLPATRAVAAALTPPRVRVRVHELAPPPVDHPLFVAARDQPRRRVVARPLYGERAAAALSLSVAEPPAPANDASDDDAVVPAPDDDVAPPGPAELPSPPRPPVRWLDELPPPVFVDAFQDRVVADALASARGFARDRWEITIRDRPQAEARLLRAIDAVLVTPGDVVGRVLRAWTASRELPGAHQSSVTGLILGSLEGGDVAAALLDAIEALPAGEVAHALAATDGFAIAEHPGESALTEDLLGSSSHVARAAGVRLRVRRRAFDVATLRGWLLEPDLDVVAQALRGIETLAASEATPLLPLAARWLGVADPNVAWHAARALLIAGSLEPLRRVRERGSVTDTLGLRALEVLILAGEGEDIPHFAWIASRFPPSPALFDAVGRFGHLGAFSRLAHALGDEDLADAAAAALETMLGPGVSPRERLAAGAWRRALLHDKPSIELRHRAGRPWSPDAVAGECVDLSCRAIEGRIAELRVRTGEMILADLESFWPVAGASIEGALATARRVGKAYPAGSYRVA
jgi:hypothetical protein